MKQGNDATCLQSVCRLFGHSRQAFYKHQQLQFNRLSQTKLIIEQVLHIRKQQPRCGGRKLLIMLQLFLQQRNIVIGRDALFDLLAQYHLLIKRRKRVIATTQSSHRFLKYPNIIREIELTHINQLWVSDLTYYKIKNKPVYINFIMDAYIKKIPGYQLAENMEAIHTQKALKMALKNNPLPAGHTLIHHSDRGTQYCWDEYIKILKKITYKSV